MDKGKEKNGVLSVPQFGGWEHKAGGATDYSMVFSRARANRKQHKTNLVHRSLENEQDLIPKPTKEDDPVLKKKKIKTRYSFNCCLRP